MGLGKDRFMKVEKGEIIAGLKERRVLGCILRRAAA